MAEEIVKREPLLPEQLDAEYQEMLARYVGLVNAVKAWAASEEAHLWQPAVKAMEKSEPPIDRAKSLIGLWQGHIGLPEKYDYHADEWYGFSRAITKGLFKVPLPDEETDDDSIRQGKVRIRCFYSGLDQTLKSMDAFATLDNAVGLFDDSVRSHLTKTDLIALAARLLDERGQGLLTLESFQRPRRELDAPPESDGEAAPSVTLTVIPRYRTELTPAMNEGQTYQTLGDQARDAKAAAWQEIVGRERQLHTLAEEITGVDSERMQKKFQEAGYK